MKKLVMLFGVGLLFAACNCSPTNPKYRCSDYGIVEVQAPLEITWKPVSGTAIVRCEPGKPISYDNLHKDY